MCSLQANRKKLEDMKSQTQDESDCECRVDAYPSLKLIASPLQIGHPTRKCHISTIVFEREVLVFGSVVFPIELKITNKPLLFNKCGFCSVVSQKIGNQKKVV